MYVPGILSSQPSQVCLPSHGTVPERRANVQKGARLRGTDRRCSAPFRGSAGRRKDAGTRWLGCCPPEMSTGETHPRAKRPMNRAKTPLRRRAAPTAELLVMNHIVGRPATSRCVQIVVFPRGFANSGSSRVQKSHPRPLRRVSVRVSDFSGEGGAFLAAECSIELVEDTQPFVHRSAHDERTEPRFCVMLRGGLNVADRVVGRGRGLFAIEVDDGGGLHARRCSRLARGLR